jgi:Glycosyl transferase family 2
VAAGDPAVSVVIPTHQRREEVRRAAATVLSQTVRELELIVVDDGSTDGTGEALDGVDPRLHYLWQENAGPAAARNAGIARSRAPVVAFLDSDNLWAPDHLEVVLAVLALHPRAVLASTCPDFLTVGRQRPARSEATDALAGQLRRATVGYLSCVAVRREALEAVGGFDERLPVLEDTDLWLRLAMVGDLARVRRRTVQRSGEGRSLMDSGRRDGRYIAAGKVSAESVIHALERHRPDAPGWLSDIARAQRHWVTAEEALARGDRVTVRAELREACRLNPVLSSHPERGVWRLRAHMPGAHLPAARLDYLSVAAEEWPEPRSDTAMYLRFAAASTAMQTGRLRQAARLLRGIPPIRVPGFAWRVAPVLTWGARRFLQLRRERGL